MHLHHNNNHKQTGGQNMNFDIANAINDAIENNKKTIENNKKMDAIASMPNDGYMDNAGIIPALNFDFDENENIGIARITESMPILKSVLIESATPFGGTPVEWDQIDNHDTIVFIFDKIGMAQKWIMDIKYDGLVDGFEIEKNVVVIYVNENAEHCLE